MILKERTYTIYDSYEQRILIIYPCGTSEYFFNLNVPLG